MGNGKWEMGNGKLGNGKWEMWEMGNGKWEMGNREYPQSQEKTV